jgi:hypothetical protein
MTRMRWLIIGWVCLSLGAGLLTDRVTAGSDRAAVLTTAQADLTPTPFSNPTATPPSQGGHGHDIFYVYCTPCHGDVGQGLTDEFRLREYPPEDTNCWNSGCHGARPYENGFTLPKTIPALIGANTLKRFTDGQAMYDYIHKSMPFNAPGSLTTEQYLQLTAFLLEQNHIVPEGARLEAGTLQNIVLQPEATPTASASSPAAVVDSSPFLLIGVITLFGVSVVLYLVRRSRSSSASR